MTSVQARLGETCPKCGQAACRVLQTRPGVRVRKRRRMCEACLHRYTTYEVQADDVQEAIQALARLKGGDTAGPG